MEKGVEKLEIYRLAHALVFRVHAVSLKLPRFELFEEGSQIRRSSKRVPASIIEGHTQRKHKGLYLSYLYRALGSADETQEYLKILHGTGSLSDPECLKSLLEGYSDLSGKIFRFIQTIESLYERPNYLRETAADNLG